jgi:hypothetical protein
MALEKLAYYITATIINEALRSYLGNSWNSCCILVYAGVFGTDHGSPNRNPPVFIMRPANTFVNYVKVKVKHSRYRPGVAWRVPES